jgi:DNA-binding PadR family transcriptional regulator
VSYIDILILRHLSKRPAHGYELRKRIEAVTGIVLHNNSLYPALRRFEEVGAVVKTSHPQQGRPAKLVYELTDVGQELLHDMLADLPAELAGDDGEFLARLGQFEFLTPAERLAVLDARDRALAERLDRLAELRGRSGGQTWSGLVTTEMIANTEQERGWLVWLRQLAENAGEAGDLVAAAEYGPHPEEAATGSQSPRDGNQSRA